MFLFLEATLKKKKKKEKNLFRKTTTKDQQSLGSFGSVGRPQVL